ncbi:MAG: S26 family signal peptidase [Gemmataceae bacterium]|nr:S26 family signal peptidase [Gemmataceae bacterium]
MKRRHAYILSLALCVLVAGCGEGTWSSGDRVLVAKFLYDTNLKPPRRWDVVVFKFPKTPVSNGVPKNYIKRLLGLGGELLAIFFGRIYVAANPPTFPEDSTVDPNRLWEREFLHSDQKSWQDGKDYWRTQGLQIERKPVGTMMAMRRPVFDNDFPPKEQTSNILPPRWPVAQGSQWQALSGHGFRHDGSAAGQEDWLRYRHIVRPRDWPVLGQHLRNEMGEVIRDEQRRETLIDENVYAQKVQQIKLRQHHPQPITDFMGYNSHQTHNATKHYDPANHNWVGDLMLECKVKVEKAQGEFVMELSKGIDRFQARWNLSSGTCTLYRLTGEGSDPTKHKRVELGKKETRLKAPGEYELRFANIDERLTVWVGSDLPFEEGLPYPEPSKRGPYANDLEPASLGSKGAAVEIRHLRLWRDTYYTLESGQPADASIKAEDYSEPSKWEPLRNLNFKTMYVQPGHYLCLGDNSAFSSDSREWGTVPERLMLGRALMVYYPFSRAGRIK